jgi:PHS family inorganic phosphate transporter-like MFS transporter
MSFFFLATIGKNHSHIKSTAYAANASVVDQIWRIIVGFGAVPAVISFILSFTKSETPQYTLEVRETQKMSTEQSLLGLAPNDARTFGTVDGEVTTFTSSTNIDNDEDHRIFGSDPRSSPDREARDFLAESSRQIRTTQTRRQVSGFCLEDIKQHILIQRNWRHLVGTSACYFMLGLSSSGLGINDSRVWKLENFTSSILHATNSSYLPQSDLSIIEVLHRDTTISVVAIFLGPLLGSVVFITINGLISRKELLRLSFLGLALCLLITGCILLSPLGEDFHKLSALRASLYIVCQIVFNVGKTAALNFYYSRHLLYTQE